MCYYAPIDILSDTIPLTIDGDKWHQELINGTVGYIEDVENGDSRRLEKFLKKDVIKFSNETGRTAQSSVPYRMPIRECL
jgi:hypothetical protein